jgi:predicted nucleic acid-binding Zn ribbon protein
MQKITEEPLKYCPNCKGPIKRLISAAGIIFKGSGFHITDYSKDRKSAPAPAKSSAAPKKK